MLLAVASLGGDGSRIALTDYIDLFVYLVLPLNCLVSRKKKIVVCVDPGVMNGIKTENQEKRVQEHWSKMECISM